MIEQIDMTPTWSGILPALMLLLEDGDAAIARAKLRRMAKVADRAVKYKARPLAMLAVIDAQLAGTPAGEGGEYTLQSLTNEHLRLVRIFIESFGGAD